MIAETVVETLKQKYQLLKSELDERGRRLWAASESLALGRGGLKAVEEATGLGNNTIRRGCRELQARREAAATVRRIRHPGGGRKPVTILDREVVAALEGLVEPTARGDPMSPLRWTCKSTRRLAAELCRQGHPISHTKVAHLLEQLGYSLQGTRKVRDGASHPDRNAQFAYINQQVKAFQQAQQPVVSVAAKKKELIGDFANKGREYRPKGQPAIVRVYDFPDKKLGKACPYGVYDMTGNQGWVSVGTDHDTAQFAVESLRRWWYHMGRKVYPPAARLLITADGGGSNASRNRLWKVALQHLADETGLTIQVCHFPPGTRKWNKIEHRMCCHITENWRGQPLTDYAVIVNLIGHTITAAGLTIQAELDQGTYPTGIKITDQQMQALTLHPADFHGQDWNYSIEPQFDTKPSSY
ncbi:MAG TPA: ISAzo13 family transposase [Candidatus Competibacteraceae bacterium]|nr:ISAzo13 family transposase [Candidatus Competibacteraceae bacterium]